MRGQPGAVAAGRGTLITFEGIGGSGKSTVSREVVAWLESQHVGLPALKEPGATSLGRELRDILVNRRDWLAPSTEAFLFEADRAQTYSELVLNALQSGKVVVFDRGPYMARLPTKHQGASSTWRSFAR